LFAQALVTTPHLSLGELSRMVYEHLQRCFIPKDPSLRFLELFQTISTVATVACGDIPRSVALVLGASKLLAMANDTGGLCPIIIGKLFFQFNTIYCL
jgi:hypothetical protein